MDKLAELLEKHLPKRYYGHEARKNARSFAEAFHEAKMKEGRRTEEELREYLLKWHESKGNFSIKDLMTWLYGNL